MFAEISPRAEHLLASGGAASKTIRMSHAVKNSKSSELDSDKIPLPTDGTEASSSLAQDIRANWQDWALFLDLDGTLIALSQSPDRLEIPEELSDLLMCLEQKAQGALAIVTGRPVEFVNRIFPGHDFTVAGLHGAEMRYGAYVDATHALAKSDGALSLNANDTVALSAAKSAVEREIAVHPGLYLEDKGAAFALHYRRATHLQSQAHQIMARALSFAPQGYQQKFGKMVVEICPGTADKGAALQRLMELTPFYERYPFVAGDDLTDEAMFAVANAAKGASMFIAAEGGTRRSLAGYSIADPAAFRQWLKELLS